MAGKLLLYDEEARDALKQGIDILAGAVKVTMGPCGRHVAYDKGWGAPAITRDGVTVAREIGLGDPRQEMGVQLLMEAATRTNDTAGDGTTTATVLAQAIVGEGIKAVVAGANPIQLARGIQAATEAVLAALRAAAIPVDSREALTQVATIAAADPAIGALVAEALATVGRDGVVTVEDARRIEDEVEYVEGMKLDRGYVSARFITDQARMEAVIEDPYVLVTDKQISTVGEVLPVLGAIATSDRRELLIIAENVVGEALATLLINKAQGNVNTVAIKAPSVGERRKDLLQDIAILTGAQVFDDQTGLSLQNVRLDDLGDCTRAVAHWDDAVIVGGQGDPAAIQSRIAQLKAAIADTTYFYDREKFQERVARLSSGVAIVRAGAATEVEMRERKARVEDALAATRAAQAEGIVPGGGVAYLNAIAALDALCLEGDAAFGVVILRQALQEPLRQIVANAGENGAVIIAEVRRYQERHGSTAWGYDAAAGEYVDLVGAGIVDPVKVTRMALENASSVAQMILTTSVAITEAPGAAASAPGSGGRAPQGSR